MPNALPGPAELRGHLIIARCGVGAPRTSPSLRGKPSPPHINFSDGETATIESKAVAGKRGAPQSGKRTLGNDDASTLLGTFFQLQSWELESINNDVGLQTTSQRHDGKGNICTLPSPNLSVSCRTQPRSRELPRYARTISAPTLPRPPPREKSRRNAPLPPPARPETLFALPPPPRYLSW